MIITNSRCAFVGYFITSYPTRAHGIIVIYYTNLTMLLAQARPYKQIGNKTYHQPTAIIMNQSNYYGLQCLLFLLFSMMNGEKQMPWLQPVCTVKG